MNNRNHTESQRETEIAVLFTYEISAPPIDSSTTDYTFILKRSERVFLPSSL